MEINGNGRKLNLPGTYQHKETGAIAELDENAGTGTSTIDAFIQAGFVKVETPVVVSQPDTDKSEYTESVTKSGSVQYRKNGKLISKDEYENK